MLCKAQCSNPTTSSCKITKCCTYDRVFITACKSPDHSRTEVKSIVDVLLCPFERLYHNESMKGVVCFISLNLNC